MLKHTACQFQYPFPVFHDVIYYFGYDASAYFFPLNLGKHEKVPFWTYEE